MSLARTATLLACSIASAAALPAQRGGNGNANAPNPFLNKRLPVERGFRAYIVADMRGMGSAVDIKELTAGNENAAAAVQTSNTVNNADYWARFRSLFTDEANAVIKGARLGGAASFVVNEVHPGNMFANLLPWDLDSAAMLIRGFPRPLFMVSGLDSTFSTVMYDGATSGAGAQGVLSRTFGFDSISVNGTRLNEVAIGALIAGEMGVSVSMVAGDDALIEETKTMLPTGFVPVITKMALGKMAAITWSPTRVQSMLRTAAADAVRRERRGEIKPFTMSKPYRIAFTISRDLPDNAVTQIAALPGFTLEKTGDRSFRFTTESAKQLGYLIDAIEPMVIR